MLTELVSVLWKAKEKSFPEFLHTTASTRYQPQDRLLACLKDLRDLKTMSRNQPRPYAAQSQIPEKKRRTRFVCRLSQARDILSPISIQI